MERTVSVKVSVNLSEVRFSVKLVNTGSVMSGMISVTNNGSAIGISSLQFLFMSLAVHSSIVI